ncbi:MULTISPECIES: anti-repressor SinI family protein [Halobacillus]|uniref:DNA-binding anti-repressor SinI n=1 Tax=Halobacillus trueperi TaxID=156205 RepID=A0A3E0J7M6_9BACI|nr:MULTISPECIES: anti-repressor SinI family protein [Halobacillus]REJ08807.1 DNA-binding anti-repressor SinI [Halobacillus trueperi]
MGNDENRIDNEWLDLIKEAKELGLSINDIKGFLQNKKY